MSAAAERPSPEAPHFEPLEMRLLFAVQPAAWADAFVDSIGIATHSKFWNTEYNPWSKVTSVIGDIGFRSLRGVSGFQLDDMPAGTKMVATVDGRPNASAILDPSPAGVRRALQALKDEFNRSDLAAVEGPNEYNGYGDPNMGANLAAFMKEAHAQMRADPFFDGIPLLAPSINYTRSNNGLIPDLTADVDGANLHIYGYDGTWKDNDFAVSREWGRFRWNTGGLPAWSTEAGFGVGSQATQTAVGRYWPRMYLENFRQGVQRTYGYQLVATINDTDQSVNPWGIVNPDYTYRPAAIGTKNLISLMADPSPTPFVAGSLDFDLVGAPADVRTLLTQKRDGTFQLAIWREVANNVDADFASAAVTVQFNHGVAAVSAARPNDGTARAPLAVTGNAVTVDVNDRVTILDITLAAAPAKPSAPTGLSVAVTSGVSTSLTWSDVAGEQGYRIERKDGPMLWQPVAFLPAGTTSYVDSGLQPGDSYAYRVVATNAGGGASTAAVGVYTPASTVTHDPINDLSKVVGSTAGWAMNSGLTTPTSGHSLNDPGWAYRTTSNTIGLTWNVAKLESFTATTTLKSFMAPDTFVKFLSSPDGTTWSPVTVRHWRGANSSIWHSILFTPTAPLPAGTNFLRMTFSGPSGDNRFHNMRFVSGNGTGAYAAPNRAPTATTDTAKTAVGTPVVIDALGNDRDADLVDVLALTGVGTPANGTAAIVDRKLRYTPKLGFAGDDSFTYTIADGRGGTATGVVNVNVPSLMFDGFDDGNADGWTLTGSNTAWSVSYDNRLRGANLASWTEKRAIWNAPSALNWTDYAFEADVSEYSTTSQPPIGLMFRYRDANNHYRFTMDDNTGRVTLVRRANGVDTTLASASGTAYAQFGDNTITRLRAEVSGATIRVFRNGVDLFGAITDASPIAAGTVGMLGVGHYVYFDNIAVYATAPAPVAVTSVQVNDGSAQRSMVNSLRVQLASPGSLTAGQLVLERLDGPLAAGVSLSVEPVAGDPTSHIVRFAGTPVVGGSLPNGVYRLTVQGAIGASALTFHRLLGDGNGDRFVDALDSRDFRRALGSATGDASYLWYYDFNADGVIDALDSREFRRSLGTSL